MDKVCRVSGPHFHGNREARVRGGRRGGESNKEAQVRGGGRWGNREAQLRQQGAHHMLGIWVEFVCLLRAGGVGAPGCPYRGDSAYWRCRSG